MRKYLPLRLGLLVLPVATAIAQEADEVVRVVGQTPLGAIVELDSIPANVQQADAALIRQQRPRDLAELMQRNFGSVFVNEAQNNPLQPDVQYRGFVGSPLLGLPQGLAVYQDGMRLNEPFGDTVSWALLPQTAVESMQLMPGSNPLFGLNALGGALSIQTKDGFTSPGTSARLWAGSFGRTGLGLATGDSIDDFGYFVAAEILDEDGWRDYSPTESAQVFSKLSWRLADTDIDLSLGLASTDLIGNGAAPVELLALDRKAIFTRPDQTENDLGQVNLSFERSVSDAWSLSGNVYLRNSDIDSLNGDDSDFEECEDTPGFICEEEDDEEELIEDGAGDLIPASDELEGATINRTATRQDTIGFGIQGELQNTLFDRNNRLVLGLAMDDSSIDFSASTELGSLDATRFAVPGGVLVGEAFTELVIETSNVGLYVADTLQLSDGIALTVSARYNSTDVVLRDQLGTALNGDHSFNRLNPAVGMTIELTDSVTAYASLSESARAPSPVELTCADEDDPCRLPNAFLADPPLEQVVARTLEGGLRGATRTVDWNASLFRTTNEDDILFISAGALTNEGYFDNIGRTRREGVELNLRGSTGTGSWYANYTFLNATFRQSLLLPSPNNPSAIDGEILVRPGDELPLLPRHMFSAGTQFRLGQHFELGAGLNYSSQFHLRGDEGNVQDEVNGYAVVNLRGDYRINDRLRLFVNIDNVLDTEFETFGLFGEADEVLGDDFENNRFLSPGTPRAAWLGVEFEL